jgi:hypothetical protein
MEARDHAELSEMITRLESRLGELSHKLAYGKAA